MQDLGPLFGPRVKSHTRAKVGKEMGRRPKQPGERKGRLLKTLQLSALTPRIERDRLLSLQNLCRVTTLRKDFAPWASPQVEPRAHEKWPKETRCDMIPTTQGVKRMMNSERRKVGHRYVGNARKGNLHDRVDGSC